MTAPSGPARRPWRALMWLSVVLAAMGLVDWIRTVQGAPAAAARTGLGLFLGGLAMAAWFGIRGARQATESRALEARSTARLMLLAELGRHDDETLERIARSPGPAAEAARMLLQGRHLGNPAGGPRPQPPGS